MTSLRILVVEDETIVARDICQQLVLLGYQVAGSTGTAQEAVALAGQLRPDLVLMDIQLGQTMGGIDAAQTIHTQYALPVVFLTAFAADEILTRANLAEPYGYILKPFSERELHTVLQMAYYKHQADTRERDLARQNQAILDNIAYGVITLNAQGLIESCNKGVCTMFDYPAQDVIGRNLTLLMPEAIHSPYAGMLKREQTQVGDSLVCEQRETQGLRRDGSVFPLSLTVSRITRAGCPIYIGILNDLSEHHLHEEKIRQLAFYDELTGLPNRRRLLDRLKLTIAACARSGQHGALILLDLDHFRQINETLGPAFGDQLLCEVAQRLQTCVRDDDTVAHLGGDEFMLMLDTLGLNAAVAATHAETVANKVLDALCQPYDLRGRPYISSASVGIVMFDQRVQAFDDLLKMADAAMYQAKDAGRKTVRFFDPTMQAQALARTELEKDLQRGLACQEFVLHYQVQVDAQGAPPMART